MSWLSRNPGRMAGSQGAEETECKEVCDPGLCQAVLLPTPVFWFSDLQTSVSSPVMYNQ